MRQYTPIVDVSLIKEGDEVWDKYRFNSIYTDGIFTVLNREGTLGIEILTDTAGFYPGSTEAREFRKIDNAMYLVTIITDEEEWE